jgi:hypothetical protein
MPGGRRVGSVVAATLLAAACASSGTPEAATTTATPSSVALTTSSTEPVAFRSAVETVTAADLPASWRPGCPVPVEQLRALAASFWGFDGRVHEGRLIVDAAQAPAVTGVLRDLFAARYPIERMEPVDVYGGSDDASVDANNTSGFNCRRATGGTGWSEHAFGRAIDLNPLQNPYVKGGTVLPAQSAPLVDRTRTDKGMIHDGDAAVRAFAKVGWEWGGHWTGLKDYQHFSADGR